MPRSPAAARRRLVAAGLELFDRQGYSNTSVAEIAAAAAVTPRTFFRHFSDKREVLFADAADLAAAIDVAGRTAIEEHDPWVVASHALGAIGDALQEDRDELRVRARVIQANPALLERDLGKQQQVADRLTALLRDRGCEQDLAELVAGVAAATFRATYTRWLHAATPPRLETALQLAFHTVHPRPTAETSPEGTHPRPVPPLPPR